jgi:replicative DNA helicase
MQIDPHGIAMLHRKEFWNPHTTKRGATQLLLEKNSDNALGTLWLGFEPRFLRLLKVDAPSSATDPQTGRHQWQWPLG